MNKNREVIVSKILPQSMKEELCRLGYSPITAKPSDGLTSELRYHPDLLSFTLPDGRILDETNAVCLSDKYPNDCVYNCLAMGNILIYGNDYIANHYGALYNQTIHVKQGYVRCSCIPLSETALITSDPSIAKALCTVFDVLKVTNNGILLGGFSCGFIGGCCGVLDKLLVFTGNIKLYEDYERIAEFALRYGYDICSLSTQPLYDYGGIIPRKPRTISNIL